jgi:Holliday junction resolvase
MVLVTNPQKIKGSAYERSIVDYLRASDFRVDRTRAGWTDDRGDIHGVTSRTGQPFTFECKNHKAINLSGWVTELYREIDNAGGVVGVVVHKKRGSTDAGEQYATLPLWMLVHILKEAGYE